MADVDGLDGLDGVDEFDGEDDGLLDGAEFDDEEVVEADAALLGVVGA